MPRYILYSTETLAKGILLLPSAGRGVTESAIPRSGSPSMGETLPIRPCVSLFP